MKDAQAQRTAEIIHDILYITLATVCEDGQPWNSPVYSAYDEDLNFYWVSDKNGQHSQNVRHDERVFIAIYDSTVPEGTGEGVYIRAVAQELANEAEIELGRMHTSQRKGAKPVPGEAAKFMGDGARRVYKATPVEIWMNSDEKDANGNFVRDIRLPVSLEAVRENLKAKN